MVALLKGSLGAARAGRKRIYTWLHLTSFWKRCLTDSTGFKCLGPATPSWAIKPKDVEIAVEGSRKTMYCFASGRYGHDVNDLLINPVSVVEMVNSTICSAID